MSPQLILPRVNNMESVFLHRKQKYRGINETPRTRTASVQLFSVLILMFCCAYSFAGSSGTSTLIRNVQIIDENAKLLKGRRNVLIKNGQIITINHKETPADKVIDGAGKYLMPGLIDSHVHLHGVPGHPFDGTDAKLIAQAQAQIPKSYLYFGFTSLLDLTSDAYAIDQWNSQELAPEAYFCSPVPIANGYPLAYQPKDKQFDSYMATHLLFDQRQADITPKSINPAEHSPKALTKRIKKEGARCVKTYYETGYGSKKDLPVPTVEMIRSLVREAHAQGLSVFLHANSEQAHQFAIDSGIDVLAHSVWHRESDNIDPLIARIAQSGIAVQPTMQVIHGDVGLFDPDFFSLAEVKHAIPASLIEWYQSDPGQWWKKRLGPMLSPNLTDDPQQAYQAVKKAVQSGLDKNKYYTRQLAQQNARLVFGSDTPSGPYFSQFPGVNGYWEIQHWVEVGISLEKLFKALTIDNAKLLGLDDVIGSVAEGKAANLLLLAKNPLEDKSAYDSIETIFLKDKIIDRRSLSASMVVTQSDDEHLKKRN